MIVAQIKDYLLSEYAHKISNSDDFFFKYGQDALNRWLAHNVDDNFRSELLDIAKNYEYILNRAESDKRFKDVLDLLLEIISYCDTKARDKIVYNRYDDKRALAMAYVRMNHWVEKLILFKFNRAEVPEGSILNAINYLLNPENEATILSQDHRKMISAKLFNKGFEQSRFINDLKEYFSPYGIKVKNISNFTYLLSCIVYSFKKEWLDDIIGIMAADNTNWQEELVNIKNDSQCVVLWNSSRPTGTNNTLKLLRNRINDGGFFKIFYSVRGQIKYIAEIIDFAENEIQLKQKAWDKKFKNILWNKKTFQEFTDGKKTAKIIFLAKSFYEIEPIVATKFEIYKSYSYPTQDNLTPIVSEPEIKTLSLTAILEPNRFMTDNITPLNRILYGPPGTGKTYKTKELAINILKPSYVEESLAEKEKRKIITDEFDRLENNDQIIFTTFHQSMSYEDFVEGIKPVLDDDNNESVQYRIEPGIFKIACANAAYQCYQKMKKDTGVNTSYTFDDLHEAFINHIQDLMEKGDPPIYETLTGKEVTVIKINKNNSIKARAKNSIARRNPAPLTKENIQKLYDKFKSVDEITNLTQVEETVQVTPRTTEFYAVFKGLKEFEKKEFKAKFEAESENIGETPDLEDKIKKFDAGVYTHAIQKYGEEAYPVVLIIDEINRGNISQIFGELITLIESDKRSGKNEGLKVKLPYSKKEFSVPPNLYLIGTMNTADRSVEALDTALRRRFSFVEMMPEYKDLYNIQFGDFNLGEVLETINNRIEALLDRDHTIGHSYFINIDSGDLDTLKNVFKNCIIPLLQEYFYGDYEKIVLIVGSGFVTIEKDMEVVFAGNTTNNTKRNKHRFTPIQNVDIVSAIKTLLNKESNDAKPE